MTPHRVNDWKHLAEQASKEQDPEKFMAFIKELDRVLAQREETMNQRRKAVNVNLLATPHDGAQP